MRLAIPIDKPCVGVTGGKAGIDLCFSKQSKKAVALLETQGCHDACQADALRNQTQLDYKPCSWNKRWGNAKLGAPFAIELMRMAVSI